MMKRAALAVAILTVTASRADSVPPKTQIVACRDGGCTTAISDIAAADYVWLWTQDAPPQRATAVEAIALVARGLTAQPQRAVVRIQRQRQDDVTPLQVIAAPAQMWGEVPEPLLPRLAVPTDGVVQIPRAHGAAWTVRVTGREEGSWWTRLDNGTTAIVPLPAVTRTVRVRNPDGAPLPAAAITIAAAGAGSARTTLAQQSADKNGAFRLESVPDREPLTLIVSANEHAPEAVTERIAQMPSAIVLQRGANVTARFVDADAKPVAGVRLRAEAWLPGSGAVVAREAVSDAAGKCALHALPAGARAVIAASRRGFAPLRKEVPIEKSVDLGTLQLEKGAVLAIRFVDDADQRPIAGARVDARLEREVRSDAKGIAQLADVSLSSPVEISTTVDGYLPSKVQLAPPFEKLTDVELTRAFTVKGRFAAASGETIAGAIARVFVGNKSRDVNLDGSAFRIALQPDEPASLEFSSPSTRAVRIDVEGARGELRDLGIVQADAGAAVRGRVIRADGTPVAGASVWTPRPVAGGPVTAWATGNMIRTHTDATGAFTLGGAGPDPLLLRIEAAGFARAFQSVSFDGSGGNIDLRDIVLNEGATVTIRGREGASNAIARLVLRPESGDVDTLTATMREGVATIPHVPAGRSVVALVRERSTICEKEIEVSSEGRPVEVDCTADVLRVRGTVLVGERPVDDGTLVWTSPHAAQLGGVIMTSVSRLGAQQQQAYGAASDVVVRVEANGRFESADLRPGRWQVQWTAADGGMTAPREIILDPKPDANVLLRYEDATLRGIVLDERSQPVRHAAVRQVGGNGFALTRDDGTFAIVGLASGSHTFKAQAAERSSESIPVTIESGRQPEAIRLVVRPGAGDELTLRVVAAHGGPAANALVFLETNTGETRIVTTGGDGTVKIAFDDGLPASVRCAAVHNGTWTFGHWRSSNTFRDGLTLAIGESGAISVVTDATGNLGIHGPHGWDLRMLMMRIGWVPQVSDQAPLQIGGLPPGNYDLLLDTHATRATVKRGETTTVTFRR